MPWDLWLPHPECPTHPHPPPRTPALANAGEAACAFTPPHRRVGVSCQRGPHPCRVAYKWTAASGACARTAHTGPSPVYSAKGKR